MRVSEASALYSTSSAGRGLMVVMIINIKRDGRWSNFLGGRAQGKILDHKSIFKGCAPFLGFARAHNLKKPNFKFWGWDIMLCERETETEQKMHVGIS